MDRQLFESGSMRHELYQGGLIKKGAAEIAERDQDHVPEACRAETGEGSSNWFLQPILNCR